MIRFVLAFLVVGPAFAQEYIVTDGPLSDNDFYKLVACAADPGQRCRDPLVNWDQPVVAVTFAPVPATYPVEKARELNRALDRAVRQIRSAAPTLNLRRVAKSQAADIVIHLQTIRAGELIAGTGYPDLDGIPIGSAQVQIFWDANLDLTEAAIVFAQDIPDDQLGPIMLEELTQAMGLMTDIRNPYYETRSVFSEDSNSVAKLGVQDRMVLRRHYANP